MASSLNVSTNHYSKYNAKRQPLDLPKKKFHNRTKSENMNSSTVPTSYGAREYVARSGGNSAKGHYALDLMQGEMRNGMLIQTVHKTKIRKTMKTVFVKNKKVKAKKSKCYAVESVHSRVSISKKRKGH